MKAPIPRWAMATALFLAAASGVPAGGPDPVSGRREIGLGEAVPEEPGRILARAGAGRDDPRTADRRRACVGALVEWIEGKYRDHPWTGSALGRCREILAGDHATGDLWERIGRLLAREGRSK